MSPEKPYDQQRIFFILKSNKSLQDDCDIVGNFCIATAAQLWGRNIREFYIHMQTHMCIHTCL